MFLSAGAIAGLVSTLALQPLDVLKTRLQESTTPASLPTIINDILLKKGDWRVLWRGTTASLLRNVPGTAAYFWLLEKLRLKMQTIPPTKNCDVSLRDGLAGGVARASIGFVMMPLTVLKVRMESSMTAKLSSLQVTSNLYRIEGVRGFFRGYLATMARDAPHAAIYVSTYHRVKKRMMKIGYKSSSLINSAVAGLVAGVAASTATHPFDVLKTHVQLGVGNVCNSRGFSAPPFPKWRVLWQGYGTRLTRKTLSSALTWTVYEIVLDIRRSNKRMQT